ncbi:MAG: phosphatase PAP2 family protein [Deltaproteobacteria bacterium]|nr:phosphatase PAP2 family protein [Deltaproteobacteria bacterium]
MNFGARLKAFLAAHWVYNRFLPVAVAVWLVTLFALGQFLPLHGVAAAALLVFAFWSDGSRKFGRILFPFLLFVIVYDSMRWYADFIRAPEIHTRPPYDFDKTLFGIREGGEVLTPNEWTQRHTVAFLDFVCGLAYTPLFFVGETVAILIALYFQGRQRWAERFVWVFVWANFLGYTLYYWYPAAPPWYVANHGFLVDLSVRANAAGALRFDKLVGAPLMEGFYGHSADVFGAIPSLHIVYPFIATVYSWRMPRVRWLALGYWLLVCFSAVYLNHHYLLDIFIGLGIALTSMWAARALFGPAQFEAEKPAAAAPVAAQSAAA